MSPTKPAFSGKSKLIKNQKYLWLPLAFMQLVGCTSLGVQPWERDLLAKEEMSLSAGGVDLSLDDHIYFSKEGTSGGRGFAGGGCGCN